MRRVIISLLTLLLFAGFLAAKSGATIADETGSGSTIFRRGNFPKEGWKGNNPHAPDWAPENPLTTPNFPRDYGLPPGNSTPIPDWVVGGRLRPGANFRVEPAPGIPPNPGGKLQVTVPNPNDVRLNYFHMP